MHKLKEEEGVASGTTTPLWNTRTGSSYDVSSFSSKGEEGNAFLIQNSQYLKKEERDPRLFRSPRYEGYLFPATEKDLIDRFFPYYSLQMVSEPLADENEKVRELMTLKVHKGDILASKSSELLDICNNSGRGVKDAKFAVDLTIRNCYEECEQLREDVERLDHQIRHVRSVSQGECWEEPRPFQDSLPAVKRLSEEMVPASLRGWLVDEAERLGVPLDYTAIPCITILGSLLGRKVAICPKEHDTWSVVPNFWGMLIGRPSLLKSPAISQIRKPLDALTEVEFARYRERSVEHEKEKLWSKAKKIKFEEQLKKAASTDEACPNLCLSPDPVAPVLKRFVTSDPTVQKMQELLSDNPQGILLLRDELLGWLRGLDRRGGEGDREFYLEGWNGSGSYITDRVSRGTVRIPAVCISILGAITPGPLSRYVVETATGGYGDDGFLQRFQLAVWPDVPLEKGVDRPPDQEARKRGVKIFEEFARLEADGDRSRELRFSPEAQPLFNDWHDQLDRRLKAGSLPPPIEAHLGKYRSLMPKLSLVFHMSKLLMEGGECSMRIGEAEASLAIDWCRYLETHAFRIYNSAQPMQGMAGAKVLLKKIQEGHLKNGFSVRETYHGKNWGDLNTAEKAMNAVQILEEHGWVRSRVVSTGGRTTTKIELHPKLRGG